MMLPFDQIPPLVVPNRSITRKGYFRRSVACVGVESTSHLACRVDGGMTESRASRRRQLANLYQAGCDDAVLRRRRPRRKRQQIKSRICQEKDELQREKDEALHASITNALRYGHQRAWHYGYRNQTSLSSSSPLAAARRYGATGTLRIIRRDASASQSAADSCDVSGDLCNVDEWTPMLRCSTSPSLATMTTPKTWPESSMYPYGSHPKRTQPSPWFDAETTANSTRPATAGSGIRRVVSRQSDTMSILKRKASLEKDDAPRIKSPTCSTIRPSSSGSPLVSGKQRAQARTQKCLNQDIDLLGGGTLCIAAQKQPLRHGLRAALEVKLERQTEEDGLKWNLLKQVLKVIKGSQHGLPLQAVEGVALMFQTTVGTARSCTKGQFMDNITGKHVGFPESELSTLFDFFRLPVRNAQGVATYAWRRGTTAKGNSSGVRHTKRPGRSAACNVIDAADWTSAVACLRLLAVPSESVLSAARGVFEVFARARSSRAEHRQRVQRDREEKERRTAMDDEHEGWKGQNGRGNTIGKSTETLAASSQGLDTMMVPPQENQKDGPILFHASLAETFRMFTIVCSNEQERHAVMTAYRHRFRLELAVVIRQRHRPNRCVHRGQRAESGVGPSNGVCFGQEPLSCRRGPPVNLQEQELNMTTPRMCYPSMSDEDFVVAEKIPNSARDDRRGNEGTMVSVSADEFSEALVRSPELMAEFDVQLEARIRHRHRPTWMAPMLRKES